MTVRHLWYLYYVPLLLIVLLSFYCALFLGKPEHYRLPMNAWLLIIPAAVLASMVLSNDKHQLVFRFPETALVWTEKSYSYGPGYYLVSSFLVLLSLISFILMLKSSRLPNRRVLYLPLLPIALGLSFTLLYALRVPFIRALFGDIALVYCLISSLYLESCIQCGLIQSNSLYRELFENSGDISLAIVGDDGSLLYGGTALSVAPEEIDAALSKPLMLGNDKILHAKSIKGGMVVWTEDAGELLSLTEKLEESRTELEERNALLEYEYEKESESKRTEELNRLYGLINSATGKQLGEIESLAEECSRTEDAKEKKKLLGRILFLGTYIKRRRDMVLSLEHSSELSFEDLSSAMAESCRALRESGIHGSCLILPSDTAPPELILGIYDLFEAVLEQLYSTAHTVIFRLSGSGEGLRAVINSDGTIAPSGLKILGWDIIYSEDEGMELIVPLGKEAASNDS